MATMAVTATLPFTGCGDGHSPPVVNPDPNGSELRDILDDGELSTLVKGQALVARRLVGLNADAGAFPGGSDGGVDGGFGGFVGSDAGFGGSDGGGFGGFGGSDGGFAGTGGGGFGGAGGSPNCFMGPIPGDAGMPFPRDGGIPGPGGGGSACFTGPLGIWDFDDCNEFRTELRDSSFNGNTAFRTVKAACTQGNANLGITLPNPKDLVYVPDQPNFNFGQGVTVAAWVNPRRLSGVQSLFRKRQGSTSSFALVLNGKKVQFVIDRKGAAPAAVEFKDIKEGEWTHVAARFDGTSLALFINGALVSSKTAVGGIVDGEGPLLMANDAFARRFDGTLDSVWFAASAAPDSVISGLTCVSRPPTLVATPATSGPVEPGRSFTYDLALKNNNSASCSPQRFFFFSNSFFPELSIAPSFNEFEISSGETRRTPVTVTAQSEAEAGERVLQFVAFGSQSSISGEARASVSFVVSEGTGCRVKTNRELMIKDLSVVDDPVRAFSNPSGNPQAGVWTFKHLMEEMAPTVAAAPDMVEGMFRTWLTPQTVNGFTLGARPSIQTILNRWPRTSDNKLDLSRPPLQLQAIVNRFDLRNVDQGNAGEGRFVFAVLDSGGFPMQFTIILEYKLPASSSSDALAWANDWHALGSLPFPSEAYNSALANLTERFARRGAAPTQPNGNALAAIRTNEIALGDIWELREFKLDRTSGLLAPATIELTPDLRFNNTTVLADWITANRDAIVAEKSEVPATFNGAPFLAGAVFNDLSGWRAPGIDEEARFHFSLNTCNGCHSSETNSGFLHINPRFPGGEAFLSGFMTGTTVFNPVSGTTRSLNDLGRRNADLASIVCPPPVARGFFAARAAALPSEANLRRGISRVH